MFLSCSSELSNLRRVMRTSEFITVSQKYHDFQLASEAWIVFVGLGPYPVGVFVNYMYNVLYSMCNITTCIMSKLN